MLLSGEKANHQDPPEGEGSAPADRHGPVVIAIRSLAIEPAPPQPEYQGQGLGTRLMRHFETHLTGQGVKGVHLSTTNHNRKAVPFYIKMGFAVVSETEAKSHPTLDDLQLLTFSKKLDALSPSDSAH